MCVHYAVYIVRVQVLFSRMTGSASKVNIVKCSGWRSSSTDSHPSLLVLSLDFTRRVCSPCWLRAWLIVDSLLLLCLQRLKHSYFSYRCTYIKITSILKNHITHCNVWQRNTDNCKWFKLRTPDVRTPAAPTSVHSVCPPALWKKQLLPHSINFSDSFNLKKYITGSTETTMFASPNKLQKETSPPHFLNLSRHPTSHWKGFLCFS